MIFYGDCLSRVVWGKYYCGNIGLVFMLFKRFCKLNCFVDMLYGILML